MRLKTIMIMVGLTVLTGQAIAQVPGDDSDSNRRILDLSASVLPDFTAGAIVDPHVVRINENTNIDDHDYSEFQEKLHNAKTIELSGFKNITDIQNQKITEAVLAFSGQPDAADREIDFIWDAGDAKGVMRFMKQATLGQYPGVIQVALRPQALNNHFTSQIADTVGKLMRAAPEASWKFIIDRNSTNMSETIKGIIAAATERKRAYSAAKDVILTLPVGINATLLKGRLDGVTIEDGLFSDNQQAALLQQHAGLLFSKRFTLKFYRTNAVLSDSYGQPKFQWTDVKSRDLFELINEARAYSKNIGIFSR